MATKVNGFTYDYDGMAREEIADEIAGCMEQAIGGIADIMDYAARHSDPYQESAIAGAAFAIRHLVEKYSDEFEMVGLIIAAHPELFASYAEAWDYPGIIEPVERLMDTARR